MPCSKSFCARSSADTRGALYEPIASSRASAAGNAPASFRQTARGALGLRERGARAQEGRQRDEDPPHHGSASPKNARMCSNSTSGASSGM